MRILLLSNLYPPHVLGGAEIVARDYASELQKLGHDVTVLTSTYGLSHTEQDQHVWRVLHYTPSAHFDHSRQAWQQLHLLTDYYRYFHYPPNVKELHRAIAELQPDVLYVWEITGVGLNTMLQALNKLHIPIVFHLESYWLHYALSPQTEQTRLRIRSLKKMLIGSVPSLAYTSMIAASDAVKQEYAAAGCDPARIEVIYNGIDAHFLNIPDQDDRKGLPHMSLEDNSSTLDNSQTLVTRLIYVGRLCVEKGVMVILKALDLLVHEEGKRHFHLDIFGDGDEAYIKELRSFIQAKQLDSLVTFHGKVPQDELIRSYDQSDIMLIPSIWKEPFGLVVAEGMARGLPIITSNLGGPAEIVTHNVDGLLLEPGNERALAAAILQLSENPTKCLQFAQAARETVRTRFLIEANAKRAEQHLQRALQSTTTTPGSQQLPEEILRFDKATQN